MNIKIYYVTLIYLLTFFSSYSQVDSTNKRSINLVDNNGLKTGLWIENNGLTEVYYTENERDGIFKCYFRINRKLAGLGEYKNGKRTGTWYYFNVKSQIYMKESEISNKNDISVKRDDGKMITPEFRSYVLRYYPNGIVKEEGIAVYIEDIEMDFFKASTWKYYDQEGNLTRTENY